MKKTLSILMIFMAFFSCRERELTQTGNPEDYVSPEFTKVPDTEKLYVFTEETSGDAFETLEWSAADFGAATEYNYQIIASIEGYDAESVVTLVSGSATSVEISQKELNDAIMYITGALSEGMVTEENVTLNIKAFIGDFPTGSGVVSSAKPANANVYPYFTPSLPGNRMYVRGDHQGWTEGDETTILGSEEEEGGPYTGYMYLNENFKVSTGATWNGGDNYGQDGEWDNQGNGIKTAISTDGGDIKVTPGPGFYFMNTNGSSSLFIEQLVFSVKGTAVPNGEIVMDYDATNRYLYANVDFVDGSFTFYATDEHNFGKGEMDGITVIGGEPIEVKAGNKMVILDLKNPGTYIYYYQGAIEITAPVLTPLTTTEYVLAKEDKDEAIEAISWSAAVFGEEELDKYQLLLGSQVLYEGTDLTTTLTVAELNAAALKNGGEAGKSLVHSLRVVAMFTEGSKLESELLELTITPYLAFQEYLYMIGGYNGWSFNEDDVVNLKDQEGNYSAWVWLDQADADNGFKFTTVDNWNDGTNYGYASDNKLSTDGGAGNIPVGATNHYDVKMNTESLTYELVPLKWGLIGAATPGEWATDSEMTLDEGTKTWTWTGDLTHGEYKFRANNEWAYNLGASDTDGVVVFDGPNMVNEDPGNYTITLTYDVDTDTFSMTKVQN
ncbi:SusF/SusE family outer membrane protein [Flammeovirga sp. SubArs3]|uniref:SusE domain-containing protein n=1 Tax=Flammeovirga sp. SubArs3 TaxID=2995316 RepID=UPI00248D28BE|nr:SusF/SusE family outer membrane protein [Flammeovirga sp. SubArs3]